MNTQREGFSLLEVVVSMILLSIALTALAGLTATTAKQALYNADTGTQQAASLETVNRFAALPYANLAGSAGCRTVGAGNNRYQSCVTVTTTSTAATIQVVTTALQRNAPALTVSFTRSAPSSQNPLCIGC